MTYQTNVPNAAQSPALFPAQGSDNFTRLKTIISSNHKFNDSAAVDDGYHQNIKMLPIAVPGNDGTIGQSFVNSADASKQLWFKDGLNRVFQITPTLPIYAAAKFVGTGASPYTILFSQNVSSVTQFAGVNGQYTLNFTTDLPSNNFIVLGMVQPASGQGFIQSFAGIYGQAFNTGFTIVQTFNFAGSLAQFQTVQVLVIGG